MISRNAGCIPLFYFTFFPRTLEWTGLGKLVVLWTQRDWSKSFYFPLQSLHKESPFWGLWAHWIATISGFPFYSLCFEISPLGVIYKWYHIGFFYCFVLPCHSVMHITLCHALRIQLAFFFSIESKALICIFLYIVNVDSNRWFKSHMLLWEKLNHGCMVTWKKVQFLPPAFLFRPRGPKEVRKYVLSVVSVQQQHLNSNMQ